MDKFLIKFDLSFSWDIGVATLEAVQIFNLVFLFGCLSVGGTITNLVAAIPFICVGASLQFWSYMSIRGKAFREGDGQTHYVVKIATTGPYRFVRHPWYLGHILSSIGFGIALLGSNVFFGLIWGCIGTMLVALSATITISAEERVLNEIADYRLYKKSTPMLFPFRI